MAHIVTFETPGVLEIKSLTTFGVNSKPMTKSPIGYFGTGLKYAIAVLVRNGIPVTLITDGKFYEFYVKDIKFRDKDFGQVMMRRKDGIFAKWRYEELPFTTELGKNWELWQAFRELESNTRDENGVTGYDHTLQETSFESKPGYTKIIVGGEKFAEQFHNMDVIFLPEGKALREAGEAVQVFNESSKYLYYRGLRVMELPNPSAFTYNILQQLQLTEDRTIASMWDAQHILMNHVVHSKDRKFIAFVADIDKEKYWEGKLQFDYHYSSPSEEFKEVMAKKSRRLEPTARGLTGLYGYAQRWIEPPKPKDPETRREKVRWWIDSGEIDGYPTLVSLLKDLLTEGFDDVDDKALNDEIPF